MIVDYFGAKNILKSSIIDILNWQNFVFYEYFNDQQTSYRSIDRYKAEYQVSFNPSLHYKNAINWLHYFCGLFEIANYKIVHYSKFRLLRHLLFFDENWLDQDEIVDAIARGFKQIDLDLINEAEKGNAIKVYELVQTGADPDIDPTDSSTISCLLGIIGSDWEYHTMLTKQTIGDKELFDSKEPYEVLESLYQAGVSKYILDIVYL